MWESRSRGAAPSWQLQHVCYTVCVLHRHRRSRRPRHGSKGRGIDQQANKTNWIGRNSGNCDGQQRDAMVVRYTAVGTSSCVRRARRTVRTDSQRQVHTPHDKYCSCQGGRFSRRCAVLPRNLLICLILCCDQCSTWGYQCAYERTGHAVGVALVLSDSTSSWPSL